MYTTYLNDHTEIAYPLLNRGRIPFPNDILQDLVLSVRVSGERLVNEEIVLTRLSTTDASVSVTLAFRSSKVLLGTFVHEGYDAGQCSLTAPGAVEGIQASGTLYIGGVQESQRNQEWTRLELPVDPSCVSFFYQDDEPLTKVAVDNGEWTADESLSFSTGGGVYLSVNEDKYTLGASLRPLPPPATYAKITSINGIAVPPGGTLHLQTDARTTELLRFRGNGRNGRRPGNYAAGDAIAVTINGTQKFPSCYSDDEAVTTGSDSDKLLDKELGRI